MDVWRYDEEVFWGFPKIRLRDGWADLVYQSPIHF
jgi:hypothetical protein